MMLKKKLLLAVVCLFANLLLSQSVYVGKSADIKCNSLDSINNIIYVFFKDYYKKIDLETFEIDSTKIVVESGFDFKDYTPLFLNSKHYFTHIEGGLVFFLKMTQLSVSTNLLITKCNVMPITLFSIQN